MGILTSLKKIFNINQKNYKVATPTNYYDSMVDTLNHNTHPLTVEEMLSVSYITRSIQMIANDVAKTDFAIYKWNAKKTYKEIQLNSKLHWLLNRQPNAEMSAFEFKKTIVWNLFLYGSAPIYVNYETINEKSVLTELIPIYPEIVSVSKNEAGKTIYTLTLNDSVNNNIVLDNEHIIYPTFESIMNVENASLPTLFKSTFNKLYENEKAVYNSILNDIGVSFIIELPDITNEEAKRNVLEAFNTMMRQKKKTGSIGFVKDKSWNIVSNNAFIDSKIDYNTRNAIAREVAAMFGIPPSKLGIEDNNKYNSMVERHRQYIDDAIKPVLQKITSCFTSFFFEWDMTQEITFKSIDLLSLDPNSLSTFASTAINNGYATPNEIRALIGFEPNKEGEHLMINSAIIPIELVVQKVTLELENLKNANKQMNEPQQTKDTQENNENLDDKNDKNII